jgi:hypothetical protein
MSHKEADERGAVLVVFAMILVAMLALAAIVVDLGLLRSQRRETQAAADMSAMAAGNWLSGRNASTAMARPRSACEAALVATKANLDNFPPAATIDCSPLPLDGSSLSCHGGSPPATVVAAGSGDYTLSITYPVPASEIAEAAFSGGAGVGDGTQCERMEVTLKYDQDSMFAGILGVDSLETEVTSVVRGGIDGIIEKVPAFLLLERTGCRVLSNSASGAGNLGIIVGAPSATEGGSIQVDSDGSDCGLNSSDYVIYGTALSGGGTSITVEDASGGALGTLSTYAVTVGNSHAASEYPGGLSHAATPGDVVSRQPVDNRYNPTIRPAITNLHAEARTRVMWSAATAGANGYTVLGCGDTNSTWTEAKVFIDCPAWAPSDVRFPNATDVVARGSINIANNRLLHMPVVERFYVGGCPGCTGGNFFGVKNAGELYVNTGSEPIGSADCANRTGPGAGGTTTNQTRMVLFGSPLDISGDAYMCQTTLYLAGDTATYSRETATFGLPNCSIGRPCPVTGASPGGSFTISGYVEWSAPSQTTTFPDASNPLEDLALWSETSDLSDIRSGGVLITSGVFFEPNARIEFRSPASGIPRDAQFIIASFEMLQGTMKLTPNPANAVGIPSTGTFGLIR